MKISKRWLLVVPVVALSVASAIMKQRMPVVWKHDKASVLWLSRDGSVLVSKSYYGEPEHQVRVWDVTNRRLLGDLPSSKGSILDVMALSNDGQRLMLGRTPYARSTGIVNCEVWEFANGLRRAWKTSYLSSTALMRGTFVGKDVKLLNFDRIETRDAGGRLRGNVTLKRERSGTAQVMCALSSDGHLAVLGDASHLKLFDAGTGRSFRTLQTLPSDAANRLSGVWFSPDSHIVAGETFEMTDPGLSQDSQPGLIIDHWMWSSTTGKIVGHWGNVGALAAPFSPDGHAMLSQDELWDYATAKERVGHERLEFRDIATQKRAKFQIARPWGKDDKRRLLNVQLSSDGKVVAALDEKGNIWVQDSR